MFTLPPIEDLFTGVFISDAALLKNKYRNIRAVLFDWDGVFNTGQKNIDGQSTFSEVDSMGVNLMRFNGYLFRKQQPIMGIVTGEHNQLAFKFARREHFHQVYHRVAHKELAFRHFCQQHHLQPHEVMYVFDDVLDFSAAKLAGLRFMVGRSCNPLTLEFAQQQRLVDYITHHDGGQNAVREVTELCLLLTNSYQKVLELRMKYAEDYKKFIGERNSIETSFYTLQGDAIVPGE